MYPTLGKGKSSSKGPWEGICFFPGGYSRQFGSFPQEDRSEKKCPPETFSHPLKDSGWKTILCFWNGLFSENKVQFFFFEIITQSSICKLAIFLQHIGYIFFFWNYHGWHLDGQEAEDSNSVIEWFCVWEERVRTIIRPHFQKPAWKQCIFQTGKLIDHVQLFFKTLPETNISPEMDGWDTFSFPFGALLPIFRGANLL